MQWKIPLTDPDIGSEEIDAVTQVLKSKWLTMGQVTADFERAFAAKMKVKHALAVSNCTAALHLANVALGIGAGDEVICPSLTFVATANAVRYTGATPVFAGVVSPYDLTLDPKDVASRISRRTRAITVVHYAGFPCLMEEISRIAARHQLHIIEDCAHAPFAWIPSADGTRRYVGSLGAVGCFSFFSNKNMTTGEGGMITTDSDALADRIRLLRSHGMTSLTYDRHKGHAARYDVVDLGYNYRLDEIRAALGLCQLAKVDRNNEDRRRIYRRYAELLTDAPDITVPFRARELEQSACHIMPVLVPCELWTGIKQRLQSDGIQTSKHYELVESFSLYRGNCSPAPLFTDQEILTLPLAPKMTIEQVEFVVERLQLAIGQQRMALSARNG